MYLGIGIASRSTIVSRILMQRLADWHINNANIQICLNHHRCTPKLLNLALFLHYL